MKRTSNLTNTEKKSIPPNHAAQTSDPLLDDSTIIELPNVEIENLQEFEDKKCKNITERKLSIFQILELMSQGKFGFYPIPAPLPTKDMRDYKDIQIRSALLGIPLPHFFGTLYGEDIQILSGINTLLSLLSFSIELDSSTEVFSHLLNSPLYSSKFKIVKSPLKFDIEKIPRAIKHRFLHYTPLFFFLYEKSSVYYEESLYDLFWLSREDGHNFTSV
jgi:hypothetical protein